MMESAMTDETRNPKDDPVEGSREVIDADLQEQASKQDQKEKSGTGSALPVIRRAKTRSWGRKASHRPGPPSGRSPRQARDDCAWSAQKSSPQGWVYVSQQDDPAPCGA
jgi:hypothetical protein